MAIAAFEECQEATVFLANVRSELLTFAEVFHSDALLRSTLEVADTVGAIEELSKVVELLQIIGAHAVQQQNIATAGETRQRVMLTGPLQPLDHDGKPRRPEFKDNAEYLRARLGISRSEAKRRLRLGASTMPGFLLTGEPSPPELETLGSAVLEARISGQAATLIHDSLERVRPVAPPDSVRLMECQLTRQAEESDLDILRVITRRWEDGLDPDGQEPSDAVLRARQGVFLRGKRAGLHRIEVMATDGQFEDLITAMNTAANPRPSNASVNASAEESTAESLTGDVLWDEPTREQKLLDGLVGACQIALSTDQLSATGGHRPQVMVTIDYEDLVNSLGRAGHASFGGLMSARTIRRIACDADLIPVVLGGNGQVLDLGRASRFFPVTLRRALAARDKGCAFPDCTMPAPWTEAHHIHAWELGGTTSVEQGVLLCSRHHHLVHDGNWKIESREGIPWFIPPRYVDPDQKARRNRYRLAGIPAPPAFVDRQ